MNVFGIPQYDRAEEKVVSATLQSGAGLVVQH